MERRPGHPSSGLGEVTQAPLDCRPQPSQMGGKDLPTDPRNHEKQTDQSP